MIRIMIVLVGLSVAAKADSQDQTVRVTMVTHLGDIEIELYGDKAPITVTNFLRLVDAGHLNGASFYRVVTYDNDNGSPKIEVIQGGLGEQESPFAPIPHENTQQSGIRHTDGVISMARGDIGTASSEFFICIGDQPGLDFGQPRNPDEQGFAAFGRVINGMDVVRAINQAPANATSDSDYTKGQILEDPVRISTVSRSD